MRVELFRGMSSQQVEKVVRVLYTDLSYCGAKGFSKICIHA